MTGDGGGGLKTRVLDRKRFRWEIYISSEKEVSTGVFFVKGGFD